MSLRDDLILQAQLYADGASVAQGTEQPPSKREDAGSTPVGGVTSLGPAARVQAAMEAFSGVDRRMTDRAGRCVHCHEAG